MPSLRQVDAIGPQEQPFRAVHPSEGIEQVERRDAALAEAGHERALRHRVACPELGLVGHHHDLEWDAARGERVTDGPQRVESRVDGCRSAVGAGRPERFVPLAVVGEVARGAVERDALEEPVQAAVEVEAADEVAPGHLQAPHLAGPRGPAGVRIVEAPDERDAGRTEAVRQCGLQPAAVVDGAPAEQRGIEHARRVLCEREPAGERRVGRDADAEGDRVAEPQPHGRRVRQPGVARVDVVALGVDTDGRPVRLADGAGAEGGREAVGILEGAVLQQGQVRARRPHVRSEQARADLQQRQQDPDAHEVGRQHPPPARPRSVGVSGAVVAHQWALGWTKPRQTVRNTILTSIHRLQCWM